MKAESFIGKIFQQTFNSLIYSNLWVALSIGAISFNFYVLNSLSVKYTAILLNVCFTFLSYNYIYWNGYYTNSEKMDKSRREWMAGNKLSSGIMLILAIVYISIQTFCFIYSQWIIVFILAILSLFYTLPSKSTKGLRWIPGFKIIIISVSWTLLIVPFQFLSILPIKANLIMGITIFFFITALTVPFDLRDFHHDLPGLKTLPHILGIKTAVVLSQLLFLTAGILLYFLFPDSIFRWINTTFILLCILAVAKSVNRQPLYYNFWLEGLPVGWGIALFMAIQ